MGSWNATCGVSSLPIHRGDDVVLFILESRDRDAIKGSGYYYANYCYEVATLPLYGKYNESGGLYDIEDKNISSVLSHLKYKLNMKKGLVDDTSFDIENTNIEGYITALGDVHDKYKLLNTPKCSGLMFVHRSIYESLIKDIKKDEDVESAISVCYAVCLASINAAKQNNMPFITNDFELVTNLTYYIKEYIMNDCEDCQDEILRVAYFDEVLNRLRKAWIPQSGLGNDLTINSSYDVLLDATSKKLIKIKEDIEA